MHRLILPALLVLGLAACDGEDPVDSVIRDVSAANHAAAATEAEAAAKAAPAVAPEPVLAATAECDVEVSFGSYGAGPDAALRDSMVSLLKADPGVTASEMKPWGREARHIIKIFFILRNALQASMLCLFNWNGGSLGKGNINL